MQRHKRGAVFLFIALLVLNSWSSVLVSANGRAGSLNTFAGGFSNVDITLQGSVIDNTSVIEIPRNVTFDSASFFIEADAAETSPGSVWLDIDQDGSNEWAFTGAGYGNFAHQNTFNDSSTYKVIPINGSNWSTSDPILLPHAASLYTADLNMSFSPQIGGGMLQLGHITDMVLGDVNNDSNEDVVILSQLNNTTGVGTGISFVTWNATNGLTNTTWTTTCDNATYSNVADLNGDGLDDVATFALDEDLACIHLTNTTTGLPGPLFELDLYGNTRDAGFADFNNDGFADIVSIHPSGTLSLRAYSNKSSAWGDNITKTIYDEDGVAAANLTQLFLGSIRFGFNVSAVVIDNTGYGVEIKWMNHAIVQTTNDFGDTTNSKIGFNIVCGDIDNDGDMDFVSRRGNGGTKITRMRNSGSWDTDRSSRSANLINATIGDHDGDGNNSLMMISPGVPDGNASTIEGQIEFKDIYYQNGWGGGWRVSSSASHPDTYPWSNPQDIVLGDMDGDGLDEQIIIAGEGNLTGLYISA
ncbi:MAG: VCBS repeat-containing protein, partial [Euryarchaeota archaeon]|nr:VCBS repeat-containing protein [Euryarchaeota archaeon]